MREFETEGYESLTEDEVAHWGGAKYAVVSYFADVLNGTTSLDEARESILSFRGSEYAVEGDTER